MRLRILAALLSALSVAPAAFAAPTTVPSSLSPGAQYRLAFVTSTSRDATSTNIADYNAFVTGVANSVVQLSALGTTWTAIASTSSVDARTNTSTDPTPAGPTGVPIFLLNDTSLAANYDDLWDGSIVVSLAVDESGSGVGGVNVWTGMTCLGSSDQSE